MSITKKLIKDNIYLFTLNNSKELKAEILNYGGIIKRLIFNGVDVVLGRDDYTNNEGYLGALVGRNSNRISNAQFTLNKTDYKLAKNDGNANLHGGITGYSHRVWDYEMFDEDEPKLILSLNSPDGEEGFPGNAELKVTYILTKNNSIVIHYEGICDADTIINMTNHTYFNLNGHNSGKIDNHTLQIDADYFTPNTEECYPNGEILSVKGTDFDFTSPKKIGDGFSGDDEQIQMFGGYDHNFIINNTGYRKFCEAKGDLSGIIMEGYTNQPGVQLYTGNGLNEANPCKDGADYKVHNAFCLETQYFPNAINYPHFPSPVLKKGEKYDTTTEYLFK